MRAALKALRQRHPARLVMAVPVAAPGTIESLRADVDYVVCLEQPVPFYAVGEHYADFHQVDDEEVLAALASVGGLHDRQPQGRDSRGR
jgi:putative phosphoribosyl transferase